MEVSVRPRIPVAEPARSTKGSVTWLAVLLAAPIVLAYALAFRFAVNIPYIDDYRSIVEFSNRFIQMPTPSDRLLWIVAAQHVEYKLVFLHLVVVGQLLLSHHINLYVLTQIGNLFLLPVLSLLWKMWFTDQADLRRRLILFLPMVLLLFNLNYAEATDWPTASLMYQPLIFFVFLSIVWLTESTGPGGSLPQFLGACFAALLACFTAANAVVLLPIGMVVLFLRRQYARMATWCVAFAVGLAPYLYRYQPEKYLEPSQPRIIPAFFFAFMGSAAPRLKLAFLLGIIILAICWVAWRAGLRRNRPAAFWAIVWLVGTSVMVAIGRNHSGIGYSQAPRYRLFSDLLLVFCYGALAEQILHSKMAWNHQRSLYQAALVVSFGLFLLGDYHGWKMLREHRNLLELDARRYWADPNTNSPLFFNEPKMDRFWTDLHFTAQAKAATETARSLGIYTIPHVPASSR